MFYFQLGFNFFICRVDNFYENLKLKRLYKISNLNIFILLISVGTIYSEFCTKFSSFFTCKQKLYCTYIEKKNKILKMPRATSIYKLQKHKYFKNKFISRKC